MFPTELQKNIDYWKRVDNCLQPEVEQFLSDSDLTPSGNNLVFLRYSDVYRLAGLVPMNGNGISYGDDRRFTDEEAADFQRVIDLAVQNGKLLYLAIGDILWKHNQFPSVLVNRVPLGNNRIIEFSRSIFGFYDHIRFVSPGLHYYETHGTTCFWVFAEQVPCEQLHLV